MISYHQVRQEAVSKISFGKLATKSPRRKALTLILFFFVSSRLSGK